jgi:hypothetical protein
MEYEASRRGLKPSSAMEASHRQGVGQSDGEVQTQIMAGKFVFYAIPRNVN